MSQHTERMKGAVVAGAILAVGGEALERLLTEGFYKATLYGPVEDRRAEFVRLRDRLFDLGYRDAVERHVAGRRSLLELVPAEIGDRHFDLWREFAAIPLEVKWSDEIHNVVTTVGKNEFLDKYLAGSSYTAAVVMGLKGTGSAVAGDTQASHAGWSEVGLANAPAYSGNRPTPSFSAASSGTKSTSSAVNFAFTSGGTVAGCFINQGGSATKDNTTGTLFSAGDFTGGSKTVANGDQLNVTYSASV